MKKKISYISIDIGVDYENCFGIFWIFRGDNVSSHGYIRNWRRYQRLINFQSELFGRKLDNAK